MPTTVLIADHDPGRSGSTVSLAYILEAFLRGGFAVTIDTPKSGADAAVLTDTGATVLPVRTHALHSFGLDTVFSNESSLASVRGLSTFMKDFVKFFWGVFHFLRSMQIVRPQIVFVNEHTLISASVAAWIMGIPAVMYVRSRLLAGTFGLRKALLKQLIVRCNASVVGITRREIDQLRDSKGRGDTLLVVPEFVLPAGSGAGRPIGVRGDASDVGPRTVATVVMLGGVQRVKGSDVFLLAAERVLASREDTAFILAGPIHASGDERERRHFRTCQELIRQLEQSGRFSYQGNLPDPSEVFRAATLVVVPSTDSHFPRPVIEAWAWGKPVVVSATPHHMDLVTNEEDGLFIPVGEDQVLADRIEYLLDHPEICRRLGAAGRRKADSVFHAGTNTEKVVTVCKRIVEAS